MVSDSNSTEVLVAGGGLVGAAIAYGLARRGVATIVLDGGDDALRPSRGNFGLVRVQGKGFGCPAYSRLTYDSAVAWQGFADDLKEASGIDVAYSKPGGAIVALSDEELETYCAKLEAIGRDADDLPVDYEVLDQPGLAKHLPGLGPDVAGGVYCPLDGHVNPLYLLRALQLGLQVHGGRYLANHEVTQIDSRSGEFRVRAGSRDFTAGKIVIAAGHGTPRLAAMIGARIPVNPEHGQIIVTERIRPVLKVTTSFARQTEEGSIMIGVSRVGRGYDTTAHLETSRDMANRATTVFPFLRSLRIVRIWACLRTMTPDGLPIYQQSKSHPGAFIVTCHSGVTLAAAHALQLARYIAEGALPEELDCFSCERFDVQAAA